MELTHAVQINSIKLHMSLEGMHYTEIRGDDGRLYLLPYYTFTDAATLEYYFNKSGATKLFGSNAERFISICRYLGSVKSNTSADHEHLLCFDATYLKSSFIYDETGLLLPLFYDDGPRIMSCKDKALAIRQALFTAYRNAVAI